MIGTVWREAKWIMGMWSKFCMTKKGANQREFVRIVEFASVVNRLLAKSGISSTRWHTWPMKFSCWVRFLIWFRHESLLLDHILFSVSSKNTTVADGVCHDIGIFIALKIHIQALDMLPFHHWWSITWFKNSLLRNISNSILLVSIERFRF